MEHSGCYGILIEEFDNLRKDFIEELKSTKIKEFKDQREKTKDKIVDVIDKVIKLLNIVKDKLI